MCTPRLLRGIQIEPCAGAKIPAIVLTRHARASRTGVGRDQHDAMQGGQALSTGLDHEHFFRAGQASQEEEHWKARAACSGGFRNKGGKTHRQTNGA